LFPCFGGAGKKGGLSENRDIGNGHIGNRCISDTFDDVIFNMSISDISIAKKWTYRSGYIGNLNISEIDISDTSEVIISDMSIPIYP
jgi:hypothetical protein